MVKDFRHWPERIIRDCKVDKNMTRLEGKIALITGASSGIGRASAIRMATDGAAIMCADVDLPGAENTANIIIQQGGNASALDLDVSDESAVRTAIETTAQTLGGLDIIFNNAGIGGGDDWDKTLAVNLSGVYYGLLHGAIYLAERGGGAIVNTASVAGLLGLIGPEIPGETPPVQSGAGAYVAAKHGVAGLTKQFALSFAKRNVRVNAIAPGYIETPMIEGIKSLSDGEAFLESLHPMGRLGQPEEIAAVAAFLASDDASFITGVVLPVDGGYTVR
jgi:NAD(P)-dependent dehydrogenase (short-subunit alcohol dehydrogenase family)